MIHYCTYFDRNYVTRALALHRSLARHSPPFSLWALCFDDDAYAVITALNLDNLRPISLAEFERSDPELLAVKPSRSTVEYYFTSTPSLALFVMARAPSPGSVTYLDADLLFYSSPQPIFDELGDGSVLVIPHRFPEQLRHLEIYGTYNVGLLTFRNDARGRAVVERWRKQCIDWCYDRYENGRFADQGYLNEWPSMSGVVISNNVGAGLAPWNFMQYRLDLTKDPLEVDGQPLIFYHFQGFKAVAPGLFELGLEDYGRMDRPLRERIYGGYIRELRHAAGTLKAMAPSLAGRASSLRRGRASWPRLVWRVLQREVMISIGR
jgi:hypothetical protein